MLASTLFSLAGFISLSTASYVLEDNYEPSSFFEMFDFFTGTDPTAGYVTYTDQSTAQAQGLINTNGPVYIGVDHTSVATGSGRSSVRITSTKSYNHGLIILDAAHMPGGVCGTWPAFWTVGPNWPAGGEIDIIEGVNSQFANSMTLHTGSGCTITNNGEFSGVLATTNCNVNAAGQATNAGCQINTPNTASFGTGFNAQSGGVYATEWTSEAISIWFFPRSAIPSDITSGSPDPTSWGPATALFSGGCDIDTFFTNQQIVFDTTFCGDWAGEVWSTDAVCSQLASTCQDYVQNSPSAFANAYWSINSLKVYQDNGSTPPPLASQSVGPPPVVTQSGGIGGGTSVSIPGGFPTSAPVPIPTGGFPTSVPIPVPTSFATSVSIPGGIPISSQQIPDNSRSFHHGDHSFTGNLVQQTTAPTVAAVGAATITDAVVLSTADSGAGGVALAQPVPTEPAATTPAVAISTAPEVVEPTTTVAAEAVTSTMPLPAVAPEKTQPAPEAVTPTFVAPEATQPTAEAVTSTPEAFTPTAAAAETTQPTAEAVTPTAAAADTTPAAPAETAPATTAPPSAAESAWRHHHPNWETMSSLHIWDFPSEGETQTAGVWEKREENLHRHLARHQKRHGWLS